MRFGKTANRQWHVRNESPARDANSQRGAIYEFIKKHPGTSTSEIGDALKFDTLESRLAEMEERGILSSEYAADLFKDEE